MPDPDEFRPPSFKVVERGRRLEVIDLRQRAAPVESSQPDQRSVKARLEAILRAVAVASRQGAVDHVGRPLLKTEEWFDADGPRTLALGPHGTHRLGAAILTFGFVAVLVMALAAWLGFSDSDWGGLVREHR